MKKFILPVLFFFSVVTFGAATRVILVDQLKSPDYTKTWSLPAATDTLTGRASTDTLTNKSVNADNNTITNIDNNEIKAAAGIVYSKLNLATSIVNADISATAAIVDTKLDTIATAGKVSNSATTATSANTNSAIVARDGSGNFSAGMITANLTGAVTGNASTATALAANPADCSAGQFAASIAANGDLSCSTPAGVALALTQINSATTATTSHDILEATANSFTVKLYTAVGNSGKVIRIKNSGTGTVTIADGDAVTETIDGASTYVLSKRYDSVELASNGTNWVSTAQHQNMRTEWVRIRYSAGTPADSTHSGNTSWITTVTDTGTGRVTLAWTGTFSAIPACFCTTDEDGVTGGNCNFAGDPTQNGVEIRLRDLAGTFADFDFDFTCVGPR